MACRVKLALVEMCYGSSMGSRVEAAAASSAPQPLAFWTSARRLTCTSILVSIVLTLRLCNACAHRSMCSAWCVWSACAEDIGRGRAERTRTRKARASTRREHVQSARAEHAQSTRKARAVHRQARACSSASGPVLSPQVSNLSCSNWIACLSTAMMRSRFGQFAPVVPGAPHGRATTTRRADDALPPIFFLPSPPPFPPFPFAAVCVLR